MNIADVGQEMHRLQRENERLRSERDDAREQRRRWHEASVADRAENGRLQREIAALRNTIDRLLKIDPASLV